MSDAIWNKFSQTLSGISTWLSDIWDKIVELPDLVWAKFNDHIWTIKDWLRQAVEGITGLSDAVWGKFSDVLDTISTAVSDILLFLSPESLLQLFTDLFVPSENYFENKFLEIKSNFSDKVGIDVSQIEVLKNTSSDDFTDIKVDIMGVNATIVDFSSFNKYLSLFRGWVKGFIGILLVFYNVDMAYFMIRGTHVLTASGWRAKE